MPSSTAWISCSRETCFSALSWRRAPTKSRLTLPPRCTGCDRQKETWGSPTPGAAVQLLGTIHPTGARLKPERSLVADPRADSDPRRRRLVAHEAAHSHARRDEA